MKRELLLEDSEAAKWEANFDRKLDSADYRTTFDCAVVVRMETANMEREGYKAFVRLFVVVQTAPDCMAAENTVVVDRFAVRTTVENRKNYMLAH